MPGVPRPDLVLVVGLLIFGFVFAVISSLHSYLILAYAGSEKAAEDVGFYYAANAAGRLMGILLSGILTQAGGMQACLWGSAIMLAICLAITVMLPTGAEARRGASPEHEPVLNHRRPRIRPEVGDGRVRALPDPLGGALHRCRHRARPVCRPALFHALGDATVAQVNLPVADPGLADDRADAAEDRSRARWARSGSIGAASPPPSGSTG